MLLTFRYRAYPLPSHLLELDHWLHELTFLWNHALERRRSAWERDHRSLAYFEQQRDLTRWRSFDAEGLGRVPVVIAQESLQRLDLAFRAFFRRVRAGGPPGFPRFRRKTRSISFVPERDPWRDGPHGTFRLAVPLLGELPVRRHRPPPNGVVKFLTVRREAVGWYLSLVYAVPDPPPSPSELPTRPVGIDLGLHHLATLSTGETVEPPRFLARSSRRLAREQRRLARRHRGSHRWERQRERVARVHQRVANQRREFAHQLSHAWAERFDLVAMEALEVERLGRGRLAAPVHDAGWSMLRSMTEYKTRLRSHRFVAVDPRGTSQHCAECGSTALEPLTLREREFVCRNGHRKDRDENAARNILARGTIEVGRKPAEVTRGEIGPLSKQGGRRTYQRRQAGSGSREFTAGRTDSRSGAKTASCGID